MPKLIINNSKTSEFVEQTKILITCPRTDSIFKLFLSTFMFLNVSIPCVYWRYQKRLYPKQTNTLHNYNWCFQFFNQKFKYKIPAHMRPIKWKPTWKPINVFFGLPIKRERWFYLRIWKFYGFYVWSYRIPYVYQNHAKGSLLIYIKKMYTGWWWEDFIK